MNTKYQISENIKTIRMLKKLTQEHIADQMGMSQANYSRIENGHIEFTINNLSSIARALNVEVNLLIDFEYPAFMSR